MSDMNRTDNEIFYWGNDTVSIRYQFNGNNCPVKIEVFNKLAIPLFVDWSKSSIIIDGFRQSFWKDDAMVNLVTNGLEIREDRTLTTSNAISRGTIKRKEQVGFIPPNSYVASTPITIRPKFIIPSRNATVSTVEIQTRLFNFPSEQFSFNADNSPFTFRTYLVLSTSEDFASPFYFDNLFWAESATKTFIKPELLVETKSNQFFISKPKKSNRKIVLGVIVIIQIIAFGSLFTS
jgi:hypothetical protein